MGLYSNDMRFGTAVPIASGATGRVVRAYDPERGGDVALKLLHRDDPLWVQRMLREADVQARLAHPHICEVFGTGTLGEQPYIAMRLIEGEPLDTALRALSDRDKAAVLAQVADAIAYAHEHGVVHRDLKPSNILVERRDGAPHAVVVDFGLVREVGAPELTRTGQLLGTPGYMAPEQATDATSVDGRADIFSLGAIAFEAFTGRRPFLGESAAEVLIETLRRDAPSLTTLRPDLDPALARIVRQCLEAEPAWRYQDAGALRDDLLAFKDGRRVNARSNSAARRFIRFSRRHPWRTGLGLVASVSLAGLVAAVAASSWYAREQSLAAQRYTDFAASIEHTMRLEWMKPAHDVAAARRRLQDQVERFLDRLPASGPAAQRTGRLAAGRALAALGARARAQRELSTAAASGEDGAELHAALGRLLMQEYFDALQATATVENTELRQTAVSQLDGQFRRPALEHLRRAAANADERGRELQAWMLWFDGRSENAAHALEQLATRLAWPVDALMLSADMAAADGVSHALEGQREQSLDAWRTAARRYEAARNVARSHAESAAGLCRVAGGLAKLTRDGLAVPSAELTAAMSHCVAVTELDSLSAPGFAALAQAEADVARLRRSLNAWDEAGIARGEAAARQALALAPSDVEASRSLGALLGLRANVAVDNGDERAPALCDESIKWLTAAQAADPDDANGAMLLANAHLVAARAAAMDGRDRFAHLKAAESVLERAVATQGAPLVLELHLIENQVWRGFEAYSAGQYPGDVLERAVERARRLQERAPEHAQVAPALGMAAWTLADFQSLTGAGDPEVADMAVGAYRKALERQDVSFADLFNAISAMHLMANQRLDQRKSAAPQVAELRTWVERLVKRADGKERIAIQVASLHHIAAREAMDSDANHAWQELIKARQAIDQALANPVDRREALELALKIEALVAQLGRANEVLPRLPGLEELVQTTSDQPRAAAALARLLLALPPDPARLARARTALQQALERMPLLAGRYAPEIGMLGLTVEAGPSA